MRAASLARRKQILLLGAIDMEHALAAAEAIGRENHSDTPDQHLIRALETALVICYWRPFSQKNSAGSLKAKDARDPQLHTDIRNLRNEVHAHIDSASGPSAGVTPLMTMTGVGGYAFTESAWEGFPEEWLLHFADIARQQRDAFRAEARGISVPTE